MRARFSLFQSHRDLAHTYWQELLQPGDHAVDATCGNGHDSVILADTVGPEGKLYALDIHPSAITATRKQLEGYPQATILQQCHSAFPEEIAPSSIKLIVYNLGYLPGSDKGHTTQTATTLESLKAALPLLVPGGALSITCYIGHTEGVIEKDAILSWAESLNPKEWSSSHHHWLNRQEPPSLLLIQKALEAEKPLC